MSNQTTADFDEMRRWIARHEDRTNHMQAQHNAWRENTLAKAASWHGEGANAHHAVMCQLDAAFTEVIDHMRSCGEGARTQLATYQSGDAGQSDVMRSVQGAVSAITAGLS